LLHLLWMLVSGALLANRISKKFERT